MGTKVYFVAVSKELATKTTSEVKIRVQQNKKGKDETFITNSKAIYYSCTVRDVIFVPRWDILSL